MVAFKIYLGRDIRHTEPTLTFNQRATVQTFRDTVSPLKSGQAIAFLALNSSLCCVIATRSVEHSPCGSNVNKACF